MRSHVAVFCCFIPEPDEPQRWNRQGIGQQKTPKHLPSFAIVHKLFTTKPGIVEQITCQLVTPERTVQAERKNIHKLRVQYLLGIGSGGTRETEANTPPTGAAQEIPSSAVRADTSEQVECQRKRNCHCSLRSGGNQRQSIVQSF